MYDEKGRKHPIRIPIPKPGGPMKDRKKYNRKRKHKRKREII
jgi:hypothetical protein